MMSDDEIAQLNATIRQAAALAQLGCVEVEIALANFAQSLYDSIDWEALGANLRAIHDILEDVQTDDDRRRQRTKADVRRKTRPGKYRWGGKAYE